MNDLPLLLKIPDLMRVLSISRTLAYEVIHRQGFPAVRTGRTVRIPRDALMKRLEEQASGSAA
jgi:excisionase family DNA binding protein